MTVDSAPISFLKRNCPICNSDKAFPKVFAEIPAESNSFSTLKESWMGFFKRSCFFTFSRCANCGFLYNQQYFGSKQLEILYSNMPDNTAGLSLKNMQNTQRGYFEFLKNINLPEGNYLELGPDIGLFSENVITELNLKHHYFVEPNKNVYDELKKRSHNKQFTILSDLFDLSQVPNQSVSLAVMIHVLDHIVSPVEMLKQIHSKLVPGGVVLIVTHDESSLLAKILQRRWPAYCLQHPHLFNRNSTKNILLSACYKDIETKKSVNYFSVTYLLNHLFWSLLHIKFKLPILESLVLPLRLGNIITIARVHNE